MTSSLIAELEALTELSRELADHAKRRGVFLVWRAQARRVANVLLRSGKVEEVATSSGSAHGVNLSVSYQSDLDVWRVVRSDGGDVLFAMPRCVLRLSASSSGDARHTVGASVASADPALFDDPATIATFLKRATSAARL